VPKLGFCTLIGHNPGSLLAFLLDNTPRKHLHLMGLSASPSHRCAAEDETLAHILCECEALASLIHAYLGFFFLDPENVQIISLGAILNFSKGTGLP
jgi:hypothetical protein